MTEFVSLEIRGDIAIVAVNNPPVNALSRGAKDALITAIRRSESDDRVQAILLIGSGSTFIAGADIREFEKMAAGLIKPEVGLHPLMQALEDCVKPVVCAIHGAALGGGFEVAMACHYRLASPSAKVGQPEVKLGLIPGAGGTQRLPRLAGMAGALEMCVCGEPVSAPEAVALGMLDDLVEGELLPGALDWTRSMLSRGMGPRKTRELTRSLQVDTPVAALLDAAREETSRRMPGRMAPLKAVDAIQAATTLPFEQGLQREEELFMECLLSDQCRALIRIFFSERDFSKAAVKSGAVLESAAGRLRRRLVNEASSLFDEGIVSGDIDAALRNFGMTWRPPAPDGFSKTGDGSRRGPHLVQQSEIVERLAYALVNEGARLLAGGGDLRASDIDVLCVRDLGFPAHRGGPMWYADTVGLAGVHARVSAFWKELGDRWAPAPLLAHLAAAGGHFCPEHGERGA